MKVSEEKLVKWIRDWFDKNGPDSPAVIGISGGKDSTILAALCARALGPDRVIGVMMPNGDQKDIDDSKDVIAYTGIKSITVNIKPIIDAFNKVATIPIPLKFTPEIILDEPDGTKLHALVTDQAMQNLPPRVRMSVLYYISQTYNGRVIDTTNLSEDYIGWGTRWGDLVGDVSPIRNITVTELIALGLEMGIPEHLVKKTPADGLCGKTDEDKFGFKYELLDAYITCEDIEGDEEALAKIRKMHETSEFKRNGIPFPMIYDVVEDVEE